MPDGVEQMETQTFTAPSYWASYLINGDDSGMHTEDKIAAEQWLTWINMGMPVSCDDLGFLWHHSAEKWCPYAAR